MSETGELLDGHLTRTTCRNGNCLVPQTINRRDYARCRKVQKDIPYDLPADQEWGSKAGKHDSEKFFHFIFICKAPPPPNVCVALTDLCGFPCIIGEVEIEYD